MHAVLKAPPAPLKSLCQCSDGALWGRPLFIVPFLCWPSGLGGSVVAAAVLRNGKAAGSCCERGPVGQRSLPHSRWVQLKSSHSAPMACAVRVFPVTPSTCEPFNWRGWGALHLGEHVCCAPAWENTWQRGGGGAELLTLARNKRSCRPLTGSGPGPSPGTSSCPLGSPWAPMGVPSPSIGEAEAPSSCQTAVQKRTLGMPKAPEAVQ